MGTPLLPTEIGPEDLQERLANGEALRLVDCREDDEWHICRIEGAVLVPLSRFMDEVPLKLPQDKETPLVVYCHHGVRSMRATLWLRQQGWVNTQSLRGGIDLWSELIDPAVPRY